MSMIKVYANFKGCREEKQDGLRNMLSVERERSKTRYWEKEVSSESAQELGLGYI